MLDKNKELYWCEKGSKNAAIIAKVICLKYYPDYGEVKVKEIFYKKGWPSGWKIGDVTMLSPIGICKTPREVIAFIFKEVR